MPEQCLLEVPDDIDDVLAPLLLRRKDFSMLRSFYFPKSEFAANIELVRGNRERYRRFVDGEFPITELPRQFERFMAGELIKAHMVCCYDARSAARTTDPRPRAPAIHNKADPIRRA